MAGAPSPARAQVSDSVKSAAHEEPEPGCFLFSAGESSRHMSLLRYLFGALPHISKIKIRELIGSGKVFVNSAQAAPSHRLKPGDVVRMRVEALPVSGRMAEPIALDVVFEDPAMLVVNKPAGMLVHATRSQLTGALLNAVMHHCRGLAGGDRPGIVNRLDRQTSGLVVVAKTAQAHRVLSKHFRNGWVGKTYVALAHGRPAKDRGIIEAPIGRRADEWPRWQVCDDGRPSRTNYLVSRTLDREIAGRARIFSILELRPETGRTHQLRIHAARIGHPIVRDYVYGRAINDEVFGPARGLSTEEPHCLHAAALSLRHPSTGELLTLTASSETVLTGWLQQLTRH